MPKTHLLNSAVMPQQGFYELSEYDGDTWAKKLIEAHSDGEFEHYIGYKSALTVVEQMTGKSFGETSTKKTDLNNGDFLFIIRLKYRVLSYEIEFFIGRYWKNRESIAMA